MCTLFGQRLLGKKDGQVRERVFRNLGVAKLRGGKGLALRKA